MSSWKPIFSTSLATRGIEIYAKGAQSAIIWEPLMLSAGKECEPLLDRGKSSTTGPSDVLAHFCSPTFSVHDFFTKRYLFLHSVNSLPRLATSAVWFHYCFDHQKVHLKRFLKAMDHQNALDSSPSAAALSPVKLLFWNADSGPNVLATLFSSYY